MNKDKDDIDDQWLRRINPQLHLVGYHDAPAHWQDKSRVIADYALQATGADGHMQIVIDSEVYDCPPDHFVIIPPGVEARRTETAARAFRRYWIHFDWEFRPDWPVRPWRAVGSEDARRLPLRPGPDYLPEGILQGPIPAARRFVQAIERLNERFHRDGPALAGRNCRGDLLQLLLDLLTGDASGPQADEIPDSVQAIRDALRQLAAMPFAKAPPVRDFLARRGQTYDHQARVFRGAFSMTPLEYVNRLRIHRAQAMLVETSQPVKQIALEMGFADVGYFNRLFRKVSGKSPTQYRRELD
jgi:AraC-like DNA-binding protein